jgi:hypothetical protein
VEVVSDHRDQVLLGDAGSIAVEDAKIRLQSTFSRPIPLVFREESRYGRYMA